MCEPESLHLETKVLKPDLRKVKTLKALKEAIRCIYGPSLEYGTEQSFSFTDTWSKENKTVNRLQKKMLQSFALTYLLPIESFCDPLCDIYFQKVSVLTTINY